MRIVAALALTCIGAATLWAGEISPLPDKIPRCGRPPRAGPRSGASTGHDRHPHQNSVTHAPVGRRPDNCSRVFATGPGRQAWIGEHVGKWLHAATLAWVYTGDAAARQDGLRGSGARQMPARRRLPGHLVAKDRWTSWDVWAHKYNLIGLITYMRYTGDTTPLPACRKMGDLLCKSSATSPASATSSRPASTSAWPRAACWSRWSGSTV